MDASALVGAQPSCLLITVLLIELSSRLGIGRDFVVQIF
jgi:hypothetical protein